MKQLIIVVVVVGTSDKSYERLQIIALDFPQ